MANHFQLIDYYRNKDAGIKHLVLLTIIETLGSSYQKAGARALVEPDGKVIGLLSGGCLEHDLAQQTQSVFDTGDMKTVFYDMRDNKDAIWGHGLGCLGAIRIMLQRLDAANDFFPLNQIAYCNEVAERMVLLTVLESSNADYPVGSNISISLKKGASGSDLLIDLSDLPEGLQNSVEEVVKLRQARIEKILLENGAFTAFLEPIQPLTRLLLIGAGKDAEPLAHFAKALGWWLTVVDHRPTNIDKARFAQADQLLNLTPQDLATSLDLNSFDAAIIMTHNLEYDRRYLQSLADSTIPFVGLLGPSHRKDKLLQSFGNKAQLLNGRLHGPVGLDIGAETPEEIALSIIACIQAGIKGKAGGYLDNPQISLDALKHHVSISR